MKKLSLTCAVLIAVSATLFAAPKIRWSAYKSNILSLTVSVPSDWKPVKNEKMLAFRYDDLAGGTAGVGILKSAQITSIDEAADKELQTSGHPADWSRSNATINGNRSIKITGTDVKDSTRRFVHYYVQAPNGVYIVQCQGNADRWNTFSPIFTKILTKLSFQ